MMGAKAIKEEAVAEKAAQAAAAAKKAADKATTLARESAGAAKNLALQVNNVAGLDKNKLQKAVVAATEAKQEAEEHLKKAKSEQTFAHGVAKAHLSGAAANNVLKTANAAVKQAEETQAAAAATLAKAASRKKMVDSKLDNSKATAKKSDLVSAKRATKAKKLQMKAIKTAEEAKKATAAFNKDAKAAAELTHEAKKAAQGAEEEQRYAALETERLTKMTEEEETEENASTQLMESPTQF